MLTGTAPHRAAHGETEGSQGPSVQIQGTRGRPPDLRPRFVLSPAWMSNKRSTKSLDHKSPTRSTGGGQAVGSLRARAPLIFSAPSAALAGCSAPSEHSAGDCGWPRGRGCVCGGGGAVLTKRALSTVHIQSRESHLIFSANALFQPLL